jgi:Domain of unknown function (DUF397)
VTDKLTWVKSSYSGGSGGNCVEAAALMDGRRAVRDSKDADGPVLVFASSQWQAFLRAVKEGRLDLA